MTIRRIPIIVFAALAVTSAVGARLALRPVGADMTKAAGVFLTGLSDAERGKALLDFEGRERLDWHFIPKDERKGLQIKEMSAEQRTAAHGLLKSALSEVGYDKADAIMDLESILHELERDRAGGPIRDPERYYFTIFGRPSETARWGLSVEGHHLSLNFVVEANRVVSSTPSFFGANPATIQTDREGGPKRGTRVLAQEEELAFELVNSLDDEQLALALIAAEAPKDIRGAGEPQPPDSAPEGIPAANLSASQQKVLQSLIEAYAANMPPEVAEERLAAVKAGGIDQIHFAWAGAKGPGIGHYYRVQGPSFLIEFVNVQPDSAGNPANHIHSMWRNLEGDFGLQAGG